MIPRACAMFVMVASILFSGCDRGGAGPKVRYGAPARTSKTFTLKGIVREVDAGAGELTIAHEDVPGFMPRMTMPFAFKDRATLAALHAGDEVEGPLRVTYEGAEVKDVELAGVKVVRAAPRGATIPVDNLAESAEPLKPGELVPDFAVTTQEGRTLRLSELHGEVVILTFIYTRCPLPEFCPAMDAKFADLDRRISAVPGRAGRLRLLSISFDPDNDTPEVLAAHAARRGAKPPLWTFAVASDAELARIAGPARAYLCAGDSRDCAQPEDGGDRSRWSARPARGRSGVVARRPAQVGVRSDPVESQMIRDRPLACSPDLDTVIHPLRAATARAAHRPAPSRSSVDVSFPARRTSPDSTARVPTGSGRPCRKMSILGQELET